MMSHVSRHHTHRLPLRRRDAGFTLVEIMVALVISLVLLGGVVQIFLSSRSSYALQEGMGRLQENARYIVGLFNTEISMAGYQLANPASALDPTGGSTEGATGAAPDSIEISYASATDCLNQSTGAGGVAINKYYIDTNNNQLMCLGNGNAKAGPLIDGVENMQILYGVDTDSDGIANEYIDASEIAAAQWADVVSVRMAFLLDTINSTQSGIDNSTFVLLNAPQIGPFTDTLRRRVFTRTFLMRNRQH